jgi:acyl-coenzyme A thioesterase PaaI-like protein
MNVNYLKAAKLNETILIEGKVTKAGSKLAYLEAKLFIKDSNSFELNKDRLVAVGFHTKYIS